MNTEDYKTLAPRIPDSPGVYQFKDAKGTTLYVGKAKSLKKRIASYFGSKKAISPKTRTMLRQAQSLDFTLVETEHDALLLENTLIKSLQPRYNVMLKDGKSYVYICIKKERFPRVFFTRRIVRDGSTYFGPYTSKYRATIILDLIKKLFRLRTCKLNLSEKNIRAGKFNVCLEYHIKNCDAPCVGYESEESYNKKIAQIKNILSGHFHSVKAHLKQQMRDHVERLEFEKAQEIKEKLAAFDNYQSKSTVVSTAIKDVDVFTIQIEPPLAFVNYLKVINGALVLAETTELTMNLNQEKEHLLQYAIPILRKRYQSIAPEVILPFDIGPLTEPVTVTIPARGDKKRLIELSQKNLRYHIARRNATNTPRQRPEERILATLQKDLHMDVLPVHIECFDNSNIMGTHPVSSCVVFKNGRPAKSEYRHYNIKTVTGPNDFASMREVVTRRYRRLLEENKDLPQLIIIDGGKGQLSAAVEALDQLGIHNRVTVIGIAKRLEEIYFPGDPYPLHIHKKSESLKLIQHARNEAHRFAISFHRLKRSKALLHSELLDIPGVGPKTAQKLIRHFGSTKTIRNATIEQIADVAGRAIAKKLAAYFGKEQ